MSIRLLTGLTLINFRCFSHVSLNLPGSKVLILGQNGAGKSSALEAGYYTCYARSPRQAGPAQMVNDEKGQDSGFVICSTLHDPETNQITELSVGWKKDDHGNKKSILIDGQSVKTHRKILDCFKMELVDGADLFNLHNSGEWRRNFLGQQQFALDGNWAEKLAHYKKTLANKTALLSGMGATGQMWLTWSEIFWEAAKPIVQWRLKFLSELRSELIELAKGLSINREKFPSIEYKSKVAYPEEIAAADFSTFSSCNDMKKIYREELALGRSTWGPHLEDWTATLGGAALKHHASRGQQKLFLILLRVAAINLAARKGVFTTTLALDDFLTDLDKVNLSICLELIKSTGSQIILTSPDPEIGREQLKEFERLVL